ncbi:MAG: long-chain fatty acid--CoA ligase [Clostridiales bacterium]|nr:long-chain fatty acid--CoA ligase [Clostridiales bacterium]
MDLAKFVERPHKVRYLKDIREIIRYGKDNYGESPAYEDKHFPGETERRKISYRQLYDDVNALGTALIKRGLKGKKIAVMSENRYDWVLTYYAVACGVGVIIPLDRELPAGELVNLLTRAQASALVYSQKQKKVVDAAIEKLDFVEYLVDMDGEGNQWRNLSIKGLLEEGYKYMEEGCTEYIDVEIDNTALMAIYFTSGTTGNSKGVMLSHRNITSNVENMLKRMYVKRTDKGLSVMPIHHTFEFTCEVVPCMVMGGTMVFCDGLKYIQKNLKEDKISVMLGVPLVFETFHKKIFTTAKLKGREEKLRKGMKLNAFLQKIGMDRSRKLFKEIYDLIGNDIRVFIVGGAPMNPEVIRDFRALGVNMFEGYGLTETSPIIAVNADYQQKTGTVGPPMPGTLVRIDNPDSEGVGEIVALTESRMIGYYEAPEETEKVILEDGWFATGDYGFMDDEGYLHITGRKKNVIVTKNGKNIFPEELEYLLNKSDYIKESVVWGKEDPETDELYITAEIVIEKDNLKGLTDEEVYSRIKDAVESVNKSTTSYKRIKKFNLREEEFEKTSTRKIKRHKLNLQ